MLNNVLKSDLKMLKKGTYFASLRFSAVIEIAVCSNVDKSISVLDTIVTKQILK